MYVYRPWVKSAKIKSEYVILDAGDTRKITLTNAQVAELIQKLQEILK